MSYKKKYCFLIRRDAFSILYVALSGRWITGSVFINEETFHFVGTELSEESVLKIIEKNIFYQWIYKNIFVSMKRILDRYI